MKLYKLINGQLLKKYNGGFVVLENRIYTNPTEEVIKQAGYKPMIVDEEPIYDSEICYLEKIYEDTEEAILAHWEIREIELLDNTFIDTQNDKEVIL